MPSAHDDKIDYAQFRPPLKHTLQISRIAVTSFKLHKSRSDLCNVVRIYICIWCSCFVPSSQTKHTLLAGLRGVVTFGSSSRGGGSPWVLALWPPTVTHVVGVSPGGTLCIWTA